MRLIMMAIGEVSSRYGDKMNMYIFMFSAVFKLVIAVSWLLSCYSDSFILKTTCNS